MSDIEKERPASRKFWIVMGLALGLPSTIVGVFFLLYHLVQNQIISWNLALGLILVVVGYMLYLMVKNGLDRKNR
jgi:predicted nucleic acid-binding Zn ribbon protein